MPSTIADIDTHVQSYRSALKSNLEVTIHSLATSHLKMDSILHPHGSDPQKIDFSALIYCLLRLPPQIDRTRLVVMGQNPDVFTEHGFKNIASWRPVTAPSRRRARFYHLRTRTLAEFVSSISDLDDIVNLLIAYQVEWNKFRQLVLLHYHSYSQFKSAIRTGDIITDLNFDPSDWHSFYITLGPHPLFRLRHLYRFTQNLRLRLLAASWVDYTKTTQRWWKHLATTVNSSTDYHLSRRPLYFVSSNTFSLLNLVTDYPRQIKKDLLHRLTHDYPQLHRIYQDIVAGNYPLAESDFLSYISQFYQHTPEYQNGINLAQSRLGITSVPSSHFLNVNAQVIPISSLAQTTHLHLRKPATLAASEALILNIDYPLGFAAYHLLSEILENATTVKGVYILGKAAVLNSELGDIEIPKVVFDEHTQNTYLFNNCFNRSFPYPNHQGSILTNQKAVTVLGTFLENEALFQKYFSNQFTVIEMESGPYLSALTEATYDQQLPKNTIVDLHSLSCDLGIINYTSDTPYSQAKNLGLGAMEIRGAEPVYLGSLAILQRIIDLEEQS